MAEALVDPQQVALVTGASGGIGGAIARRLVEQGFYVHGVTSKEDKAAGFLESIGGEAKGRAHVLDLAQLGKVNKWCQDTFTGAAPNVVVHAAGIIEDAFLFDRKPLTEAEIKTTELVMAVNALAPWVIERNFGMRRRKQGGAVLFVSSMSFHEGNPKQSRYAMSKGAMEGLERVASRELGGDEPDNARVNAIAYGPVNTEMWRQVPKGTREKVEAEMANKRAFTEDEAAAAAMDILVGGYSNQNGSTFLLDGGLLAKLGVTNSAFIRLG